MRKCGKWPVGLTSWSYNVGIVELKHLMSALEVDTLQLQILPALRGNHEWLGVAKDAPWQVFSTMHNFEWEAENGGTQDDYRRLCGIGNDAHWEELRRDFARGCALTAELGAAYTLMHIGHIDFSDAARGKTLVERARVMGDIAADAGVSILLETGMEPAADLRRLIEEADRPSLQVNFDPANLLSFHSDEPLPALALLRPWVKSVHVKDTIPNPVRGISGDEQVWGDGDVNANRFLRELERGGFDGPVFIEREKGEDPIRDAALALRRLESYK